MATSTRPTQTSAKTATAVESRLDSRHQPSVGVKVLAGRQPQPEFDGTFLKNKRRFAFGRTHSKKGSINLERFPAEFWTHAPGHDGHPHRMCKFCIFWKIDRRSRLDNRRPRRGSIRSRHTRASMYSKAPINYDDIPSVLSMFESHGSGRNASSSSLSSAAVRNTIRQSGLDHYKEPATSRTRYVSSFGDLVLISGFDTSERRLANTVQRRPLSKRLSWVSLGRRVPNSLMRT